MKTGCSWCLSTEHVLANCSQAAALAVVREHGIVDPMASEELNDQVALRMIRERVAKGAYRKLCLDAGIPIPEDVLQLDADRHLYA